MSGTDKSSSLTIAKIKGSTEEKTTRPPTSILDTSPTSKFIKEQEQIGALLQNRKWFRITHKFQGQKLPQCQRPNAFKFTNENSPRKKYGA